MAENQQEQHSSNFYTSTPLNFRNRFTIPPPMSFDSPTTMQGPLLFRSHHNETHMGAANFNFPSSYGTGAGNSNTTLYFPTSSTSSYGPDHAIASTSQNNESLSSSALSSSTSSKGRGKNWSDAETRFLLQIWTDNYPVSKRKNSGAWDAIAKQLNKVLTEQGIKSYRSGTQCKTRMKHLEDDYKSVKDNNNRSGRNRETCDYYEELDSVLGCKPNITPTNVVECGLGESDNESSFEFDSSTGSEKKSASSKDDDGGNDEADDEEKEVAETRKKQKRSGKGKQPVARRAKRAKAESDLDSSDFMEFLRTSQEKDHADSSSNWQKRKTNAS